VIYGGINEIQGRPFGHLTLTLTTDAQDDAPADAAVIDAALDRVRLLTTVTEVR
jgi:D-methionine transport system ATP-binding protein